MFTFRVADMTCGHCAGKIARAVAGVDAGARVAFDIPGKVVTITSAAPADELADAIRDAGYSPETAAAIPQNRAPSASGCGCGCGTRRAAPVDVSQAAVSTARSCCG